MAKTLDINATEWSWPILHIRQALDISKTSLPLDYDTAHRLSYRLAIMLARSGNWQMALPIFQEALSVQERIAGKDHSAPLGCANLDRTFLMEHRGRMLPR